MIKRLMVLVFCVAFFAPQTHAETCKRYVYIDIPLSAELQRHTQDVAQEYGIPLAEIYAVMSCESSFRDGLVCKNKNGSRDVGLMQINSCNLKEIEALGLDVFDARDNIEAGVYLLKKCIDAFDGDVKCGIMAYNRGIAGARRILKTGNVTPYVQKAVKRAARFRLMIAKQVIPCLRRETRKSNKFIVLQMEK